MYRKYTPIISFLTNEIVLFSISKNIKIYESFILSMCVYIYINYIFPICRKTLYHFNYFKKLIVIQNYYVREWEERHRGLFSIGSVSK